MPFLVETSQTHRGIKLYASKVVPPSRALVLAGIKEKAVRFPTHIDAVVAASRFSSLYGLVITEVTDAK